MKNKTLSHDNILKLMQSLDFFGEFSEDELEILLSQQEIIKYHPDEVIISEGDLDIAFFIILKGRVSITKKMHRSPIARQLTELATGQCFGEMAVITGKPRSATVVALDETYVFKVLPEMLTATRDDPVRLQIETKMYKRFARELAGKIESHNIRNGYILF